MKRRAIRIFAMAMVLLLVSLTACSKKEDNDRTDRNTKQDKSDSKNNDKKNIDTDSDTADNSEDDYNDEGNQGGSVFGGSEGGSSSENTTALRNELDLSVYVTDTDILHIVVEGESCARLQKENTEMFMRFSNDEESQISISRNYASIGARDASGEWVSFYADSYSGQFSVYDNYIGITLTGSGIEKVIPKDAEYLIYIHDGDYDFSDRNVYGHGKLTNVYKIAEEEMNAVVGTEAVHYVPSRTANEFWVGDYLCSSEVYTDDGYKYRNGYCTIDLTENGALALNVHMDGADKCYVFEEINFDEATYDYGTVLEARAELPAQNNRNGSLSYSGNASGSDSYYFNYSDYTDHNEDLNMSLYRYVSSRNDAPADYKDVDKYGYISDELSNPNNFLASTADDFVLSYNGNNTYYIDENKSIPYASMELHEFDVNGICVRYKQSYFASSSSDADALYAQMTRWNPNGYTREGNRINYDGDYAPLSSKEGLISYNYNAYNGTHYAYYDVTYYGDPDSVEIYRYFVNPIKRSNGLDFETAKEFISLLTGTHRSTDDPDGELYTSFYTYAGEFTYSVYAGDMSFSLDTKAQNLYEGKTVKSMVYSNGYSYDNDYVLVYAADFSGDVATVTKYYYVVDGFDDVRITLKNHESFTPDSVVSHSFDMTRVKQN